MIYIPDVSTHQDIMLLSETKFVTTEAKYAQFFTREQLCCVKSDQEAAVSRRVSCCRPQEAFEGCKQKRACAQSVLFCTMQLIIFPLIHLIYFCFHSDLRNKVFSCVPRLNWVACNCD